LIEKKKNNEKEIGYLGRVSGARGRSNAHGNSVSFTEKLDFLPGNILMQILQTQSN